MQAGSDAYDLLGAARNNDWELVEGLAESGTFPDTSLQVFLIPILTVMATQSIIYLFLS